MESRVQAKTLCLATLAYQNFLKLLFFNPKAFPLNRIQTDPRYTF